MKHLKYFLFISGLFISFFSNAQSINWAALKNEQKNIVNVHISADYAFSYGAVYGYQLKTKLPVIITAEYSNRNWADRYAGINRTAFIFHQGCWVSSEDLKMVMQGS
jgi:hypothetical protein